MQIIVKPQDKRPLETAEFQLHPDVLARLRAYAQSLGDSDVSYVLGQILQQALPPDKGFKKTKTEPVDKLKKERAAKAA